jgi:uncharacterized membrane protein
MGAIMNPWFVFVAMFLALTAIRRKVRICHVQDHEALVRAKAALVVMVHMETLLRAVDQELANRRSL